MPSDSQTTANTEAEEGRARSDLQLKVSVHGGSDGKASARSAGDDPLEKGMATHSSTLA